MRSIATIAIDQQPSYFFFATRFRVVFFGVVFVVFFFVVFFAGLLLVVSSADASLVGADFTGGVLGGAGIVTR